MVGHAAQYYLSNSRIIFALVVALVGIRDSIPTFLLPQIYYSSVATCTLAIAIHNGLFFPNEIISHKAEKLFSLQLESIFTFKRKKVPIHSYMKLTLYLPFHYTCSTKKHFIICQHNFHQPITFISSQEKRQNTNRTRRWRG